MSGNPLDSTTGERAPRRRLRAWKAEHPVLTRPLGRGIAETGKSDPARQATFDRFDARWMRSISFLPTCETDWDLISPSTCMRPTPLSEINHAAIMF
jgi:hypothetical protein